MANNNTRPFLDLHGLQTLWNKIKSTFADKRSVDTAISNINTSISQVKVDIINVNDELTIIETNMENFNDDIKSLESTVENKVVEINQAVDKVESIVDNTVTENELSEAVSIVKNEVLTEVSETYVTIDEVSTHIDPDVVKQIVLKSPELRATSDQIDQII